MPLPFAAPAAPAWPLPWVLVLVVVAMIVFAVLGVRDLLGQRQGRRTDEDDRPPPAP